MSTELIHPLRPGLENLLGQVERYTSCGRTIHLVGLPANARDFGDDFTEATGWTLTEDCREVEYGVDLPINTAVKVTPGACVVLDTLSGVIQVFPTATSFEARYPRDREPTLVCQHADCKEHVDHPRHFVFCETCRHRRLVCEDHYDTSAAHSSARSRALAELSRVLAESPPGPVRDAAVEALRNQIARMGQRPLKECRVCSGTAEVEPNPLGKGRYPVRDESYVLHHERLGYRLVTPANRVYGAPWGRENPDPGLPVYQYDHCLHCGGLIHWNFGDFMVTDAVWSQSGFAPYSGLLHVHCLERRIGRMITGSDLLDLPINELHRAFFKRGFDLFYRRAWPAGVDPAEGEGR